MATAEKLLSEYRLGPTTLKNRIVMAPLTRSRGGADNIPSEMAVTYYEQRASAGLIITEATPVSPQAIGYPGLPGIFTDAQVAMWRKITDAVHAKGGKIFMQLWHVGRISHPSLQIDGALPVAPSPIKPAGEVFTAAGMQPFLTPRALELNELPGIVAMFADGARRAKDAGFDGIEVHGANGYLLDQFLRDGTNHRTDAYGGSVENRARLLLEVTAAVANVWGADRVGVRLSPLSPFNDMRDSDPAGTFPYVANALNALGTAYLHVVEPIAADEAATASGTQPISALLREAYQGTFIANGGYTRESGEQAIASGSADLVAYGTLFISNPDLPERFAHDYPLAQGDVSTFYGGGAEGYIDYPAYAGS